MEEMLAVLEEIRDRLVSIDEKLDKIQGDGRFSSISDVYSKLDDIETTIQLNS